MKRPAKAQGKERQAGGTCPDPRLTRAYPCLMAFLGDRAWDDGQPRTPGTITIFMEDDMLKAALNDRDEGMSMYASGGTLDGVLGSLEGHLADEDGDWRAWKSAGAKKGR